MNESSKASSVNFLTDAGGRGGGVGGTPCDIKSNLLLTKLLGQHSKEDNSPEVKEQNEKKISAEFVDSDDESSHNAHSEHHADTRVKMVYDLLSTLNTNNKEEISKIFLAMTRSPESCVVLRQSGCVPLLLQLIHGNGSTKLVRKQASLALHYIVQHNSEDKQGRRELRVFRLIEQILQYCECNEDSEESEAAAATTVAAATGSANSTTTSAGSAANDNPTSAVASLMKLSFDEEYRHAMCQFGALHALAKLIQTDDEAHKAKEEVADGLSQDSVNVRRYAGMALTNLTFGDSTNKALLCSLKPFMLALVAQLNSSSEDLCQVTAGVLRNLSWRADTFIKETLREINAVTSLMRTALRVKKESTLKAVLSALWNLSAHSNHNKIDICNVEGAIEYLVKMLNYQAPSGTLVIVESVGGILRNISSLIAIKDDYRAIIREYNCLYVLLHQLKSPSLTIVSNACGTLWNLTARCSEDQHTLCQLGAVPMLRSLIHSKHKMISVASTAALRNLISSKPDSGVLDGNRTGTALVMRKRRALEQEIDAKLRETSSENLGQLSFDSTTPAYSEHCNYGSGVGGGGGGSKSGSVKNSELSIRSFSSAMDGDKDAAATTTDESSNGNGSVRFDLSSSEKSRKCVTPRTTRSQQANATATTKFKEQRNGYCSNEEEDELRSAKRNGFRKVEEPYNVDDSFGDYAETDLDQPTDYSLRFVEHGCSEHRRGETTETKMAPVTATAATVLAEETSSSSSPDKKMCSVAETPLMFSRSSSLGTVSSCGEPADDRSSVVSEFSRVVSGIISPSDLPDSPTETVPPSPPSATKNEGFYTLAEKECGGADGSGKSKSKIPIRRSVFEDSVTVFKDETTPIQFSVATSLSSLTFDEESHLDGAAESRPSRNGGDLTETEKSGKRGGSFSKSGSNSNTGSTLSAKNSATETYNKEDSLEELELSVEEQQAMLQACIDSAKPPVVASQQSRFKKEEKYSSLRVEDQSIPPATLLSDSTINFCTEDTPILISHAASNSDLSLLCPSEDSFLQNSILPLSSCHDPVDIELSNEEQKKLLNFCIATGLQSLSNDSNDSFNERKSSQSSTLSEITEDLLTEDRTLLKDCTPESVNLLATSTTENEFSFAPELVNKELSEEEEKNLLNQCIALGMRSMKESSDLENVGPPSFLDEANLDSSLTNIEEITDYPPGKTQKERCTPRQKRHQIRERYNTYTVKMSPSKSPPETIVVENSKKCNAFKEKRSNEKDRFRTRTLSKGDFEDITKCQQQDSKPPRSPPTSYAFDETYTLNSSSENVEQQGKAKIVKPVVRVKSGIPIVRSKLNTSKSTGNIKACSNTVPELPAPLQRQNTFTKEEPSGIPVRKNSLKNNAKSPSTESAPQIKSGIPSRIREPSGRSNAKVNDRSPDIAKNRWSVSDNNLNAGSTLKATSNTSLNAASNYANSQTRVSPSASQSALPVRREYGGKSISYGYRK